MKQAKSLKEFVFHRREPEVHDDLIALAGAKALFERDVISISESLIEGVQFEECNATSLFMEASVVERVNLSNCRFGSVKLADVRLVNCDLGNLEARAMSLVRVHQLPHDRVSCGEAGVSRRPDLTGRPTVLSIPVLSFQVVGVRVLQLRGC